MCRCEVIYLQRRSERKKLDFWLLLGGFSRITPPNEVRFVQNFHQWCIARQRIIYNTVFENILKIPKNSAEKLNFWLIFGSFLIPPSYALLVTPQFFAKLKVLWRCTILVSFIFIAFLVVKLWNLKCFHGNAASMKWPILGGFWTLTPPNMVRSCWNFYQT